ncbi:MAG TPA: hypothetical protein VGM37_09420 [Armatimonadota bacterium]|jgi:hypothetical protein
MGRAEDLFTRITSLGEEAIDELFAHRKSEELFLDFKRSADNGSGARLHDKDLGNLGKAISGFGNSEGGLLIWGVDCRDAGSGDLPNAKVPIHDPVRFVSWLDGAVSGRTLPPHTGVRHFPLASSMTTSGFVVTLIPKGLHVPLQAVGAWQYYIRAGSSFAPAPYGVLAAMFGRRPQPTIEHTWTSVRPKILRPPATSPVVAFHVDFGLFTNGPGVIRDVYATLHIFPPDGESVMRLRATDPGNWTNAQAFNLLTSLVSKDGVKLPPQMPVYPIRLEFELTPPFPGGFKYRVFYGCDGSPTCQLDHEVSDEELAGAYTGYFNAPGEETERALLRAVLGVPHLDEPGASR